MTRQPLYSVNTDDDLMKAMRLAGAHRLNQLLVLEGDRLVGMIRRADILHYLHTSQELSLPGRGRLPDRSP
jgi:predicted transcriptional regulator